MNPREGTRRVHGLWGVADADKRRKTAARGRVRCSARLSGRAEKDYVLPVVGTGLDKNAAALVAQKHEPGHLQAPPGDILALDYGLDDHAPISPRPIITPPLPLSS